MYLLERRESLSRASAPARHPPPRGEAVSGRNHWKCCKELERARALLERWVDGFARAADEELEYIDVGHSDEKYYGLSRAANDTRAFLAPACTCVWGMIPGRPQPHADDCPAAWHQVGTKSALSGGGA